MIDKPIMQALALTSQLTWKSPLLRPVYFYFSSFWSLKQIGEEMWDWARLSLSHDSWASGISGVKLQHLWSLLSSPSIHTFFLYLLFILCVSNSVIVFVSCTHFFLSLFFLEKKMWACLFWIIIINFWTHRVFILIAISYLRLSVIVIFFRNYFGLKLYII